MSVNELLVLALVLVNGCYIGYMHLRLRRLDEINKTQAAADRRLVVTALEVCGELRSLAADLAKHEQAACKQYEKLSSFMSLIIKRHFMVDPADAPRPGHGRRTNGQATGPRPGNGQVVLHERPGMQPFDGLN